MSREELETLIKEGLTRTQIEQRLNFVRGGGLAYWLRKHNLKVIAKYNIALKPEQLIKYVGTNLTAAEIAEKEGCCEDTVKKWAKKYKIPLPRRQGDSIHTGRRFESLEWKIQMENYIRCGLSVVQIAKREKMGWQTINRYLKFHGLRTLSAKKRGELTRQQREKLVDFTELKRRIEAGESYKTIGTALKLPIDQVGELRRKYKIKGPRRLPSESKALLTKETCESFISQGMCQKDISKATGHCNDTISRYLKKYGLKAANGFEWKTRSNSPSPPCEHLKTVLASAGFTFESEYRVFQDRKISLDIAFVKQRLGLEINGNFHYSDTKNGILAPYYQERHDTVCAAGWTLIEIPFRRVWDETYVQKLLATIRLTIAQTA